MTNGEIKIGQGKVNFFENIGRIFLLADKDDRPELLYIRLIKRQPDVIYF